MMARGLHWLVAALLALQEPAAPAGDPLQAALEKLGATSLPELEQRYGQGQDAAYASALLEVGRELARRGRWAEAERAQHEAWRVRSALYGAGDARALYCAHQRIRALAFSGRFDEALSIGDDAVQAADQAGGTDSSVLRVLLNNHAVTLQAVGELGRAETLLERALGLLEATDPKATDLATALFNLGNLQRERGRTRASLANAERCLQLRLASCHEDSYEVGAARLLLGMLRFETGELFEAEVSLRQAERVLRAAQGPHAARLGSALAMLGRLCLAKGELAAAQAYLLEAVERMQKDPRLAEIELPTTRLALATAYVLDRRFDQAQALLDEQSTDPEDLSLLAVQSRITRAVLHAGRGDPEQAAALLTSEVERIAAAPELPPTLQASARMNLADLLQRSGALASALEQLDLAQALLEARHGRDSNMLLELCARRAGLFELQGQLDRAAEAAVLALDLAEAQLPRLAPGDLERARLGATLGSDAAASVLARVSLARDDPAAALEAQERARCQPLLGALARVRLDDRASDARTQRRRALLDQEESARVALRELESRRAAQAGSTGTTEPVTLDQISALRIALDEASAHLVEQQSLAPRPFAPASAARVRAALAPDEALLSCLWSDRGAAWIVLPTAGADRKPFVAPIASSADELEALRGATLESAAALATDPRQRGEVDLAPLARWFPASLRERLRGVRRIIVVPDGPLGALPLELALTQEFAPDLVMAPSATTWLALAEPKSVESNAGRAADPAGATPTPAPEPETAVVLGDPHFGAGSLVALRGTTERAELPSSRAEARYVARLLQSAGLEVELLTAQDATRSRLEAHSGGARFLHLATHGFPGTQVAPYDAALALSSEDAAHLTGGSDSLTLDRLARRWPGKLEGCGLVVLSACDTNRAVSVGSGMYALSTGFFFAGARNVIASLWKVDDRATALLMGRVYENLTGYQLDLSAASALATSTARGALPLDQALFEAKRWLAAASRDEIRRVSRRMALDADPETTRSAEATLPQTASTSALVPYADPYFWSGFVLLGRGE